MMNDTSAPAVWFEVEWQESDEWVALSARFEREEEAYREARRFRWIAYPGGDGARDA